MTLWIHWKGTAFSIKHEISFIQNRINSHTEIAHLQEAIKRPHITWISWVYKPRLWRNTAGSTSVSKSKSYQVDLSSLAVCWDLARRSSIVGLGEWLSAAGLQRPSRLFCCHSIPSWARLPSRESPEKRGADLVHLCFPWCCSLTQEFAVPVLHPPQFG